MWTPFRSNVFCEPESCYHSFTADATVAVPFRSLTLARVVRSTFASIGRTMKTFGMVSSYSCICCLVRAHSWRRRFVFTVQMPFGEVVVYETQWKCEARIREPKPTYTHTPLTRIALNEYTHTHAYAVCCVCVRCARTQMPFNSIRKLVWSAHKLYMYA